MQVTNMQELPINDFLHDDMLLKVMDSNPWYVNIVNYMVAGYVPPGEDQRKLQVESRRHLWDDPYLYRVCSDGLLRRCVPTAEGWQIIEKMSCGTIWRPLWSVPHTSQDLAVWILLAIHV
jgi:hypothetical protein